MNKEMIAVVGSTEDKKNAKSCVKANVCVAECSRHVGIVQLVRMKGEDGLDWGYFSFCEIAIFEARERGCKIRVLLR